MKPNRGAEGFIEMTEQLWDHRCQRGRIGLLAFPARSGLLPVVSSLAACSVVLSDHFHCFPSETLVFPDRKA